MSRRKNNLTPVSAERADIAQLLQHFGQAMADEGQTPGVSELIRLVQYGGELPRLQKKLILAGWVEGIAPVEA